MLTPFLQDPVVRLLGGLTLLMGATIIWGLWVSGDLHEGHWEEFQVWAKKRLASFWKLR